MSMRVIQPGLLSLIQDSGRHGKHNIGLTTGGPMDGQAFAICNRLLGNEPGSTLIEISFGGLQLEAQVDTFVCITGAEIPLTINGQDAALWQSHRVRAGDVIALEFTTAGCRAYLGVVGGFDIPQSFGSSATVMREHIGGLNGEKLHSGDQLPCATVTEHRCKQLPLEHQPRYHDSVTVRVIPGYQQSHFSRLQQRRFFSSTYEVSDRCDRMGYRLEGPAIDCGISGILSEGICHGAIQIPADGQPIVLLNDRQTIGGYPKIGSALSLDTHALAQLRPGGKVFFTPISTHAAHNALHLANSYILRQPIRECPP